MNDEDAFHAALDGEPANHMLRLVFADWLEDRDDPRAEGYRMLGQMRFNPCHLRPTTLPEHDHWMFQLLNNRHWHWHDGYTYTFDANNAYEIEWFRAFCERVFGSHHRSRRIAEDTAAKAFATLPESVKEGLRQLAALTPSAAPSPDSAG